MKLLRPVEIPKPNVYPLVLIRLPSDVKKVENKVPNEVIPDSGKAQVHHQLPEEVWLNIFKYLSTRDKSAISLTCKSFNRFACSRQLWRVIDLSNLSSFSSGTLRWLLRRAPESIVLPCCINYRSLVWLLSRSPMLRKLTIHGASWSAISAVNTQQAPLIKSLDLSWSSMNDASVEELVSSPTGHIRPGIKILNSRLSKLTELILNGSDITDLSLCQISKLPELKYLSIQACVQITADGLEQFNDEECLAPLSDKLNIRDCCSLKPKALEVLLTLIETKSPKALILSETNNITIDDFESFLQSQSDEIKSTIEQKVTFHRLKPVY